MNRIVFPEDFVKKTTLFGKIVSKNTADGASSVLTAFLAEKEIDLTADAEDVATAQTHETSRLLLTKQSGNYYQLGELKMKPVMEHVRGILQFLKSFYKPNFKGLGDWGATITDSGKIIIPTDVADQVTLLTNIQTQHGSYLTGQSPLLPYLAQNKIDLPTDATAAASAQDYFTKAGDAAKSAEEETQQRDNLMNPVNTHIHQIGDFLKKLFNVNAKSLGEWGFVVNNSPQKPKMRTSTVKPGATGVFKSILVGSTLTSLATGDIHIYPGLKTTGTPIIVHAGEQLGMTKGFSTITVVNPSTLLPIKFKVLRSK